MALKSTKNSASAIAEKDSVLSIKDTASVPQAKNKPPNGNSKDRNGRKGGSGGNGKCNGTQNNNIQLRVEQRVLDTPAAATSQTNYPDSSPAASGEVTCFRCRQVCHYQKVCAQARKLVCFAWEKEGYTIWTCPDCSN